MKRLYLFILLAAISQLSIAQETNEELKSYHKFSLVMSNCHVPDGISDGNKQWLVLSAWGIDYDFGINSKWAIGIHTDIVLENYVVNSMSAEENVIERSFPITISSVAMYKPKEHLSFILGPGIETAKEEDLYLILAGLEYGWELEKDWEISLSLTNEFKVDKYNSWAFGIGISKLIFK